MTRGAWKSTSGISSAPFQRKRPLKIPISTFIGQQYFEAILRGDQTTESRWVYPSNKGLYFDPIEVREKGFTPDELGFDVSGDEDIIYFDTLGTVLSAPREYDYLRLINGRRKDAPELTVEIIDASPEINVDENDKPYLIADTYRGEKVACIALGVNYTLGKIVETKNIP